MKRKIVTNYGETKKLAKLFRCTPEMASYALNFRKNSLLARKIRKAAIERGGIDTGEVNNQPKQGGAQ
jgi:hypothetical protein